MKSWLGTDGGGPGFDAIGVDGMHHGLGAECPGRLGGQVELIVGRWSKASLGVEVVDGGEGVGDGDRARSGVLGSVPLGEYGFVR